MRMDLSVLYQFSGYQQILFHEVEKNIKKIQNRILTRLGLMPTLSAASNANKRFLFCIAKRKTMDERRDSTGTYRLLTMTKQVVPCQLCRSVLFQEGKFRLCATGENDIYWHPTKDKVLLHRSLVAFSRFTTFTTILLYCFFHRTMSQMIKLGIALMYFWLRQEDWDWGQPGLYSET